MDNDDIVIIVGEEGILKIKIDKVELLEGVETVIDKGCLRTLFAKK